MADQEHNDSIIHVELDHQSENTATTKALKDKKLGEAPKLIEDIAGIDVIEDIKDAEVVETLEVTVQVDKDKYDEVDKLDKTDETAKANKTNKVDKLILLQQALKRGDANSIGQMVLDGSCMAMTRAQFDQLMQAGQERNTLVGGLLQLSQFLLPLLSDEGRAVWRPFIDKESKFKIDTKELAKQVSAKTFGLRNRFDKFEKLLDTKVLEGLELGSFLEICVRYQVPLDKVFDVLVNDLGIQLFAKAPDPNHHHHNQHKALPKPT